MAKPRTISFYKRRSSFFYFAASMNMYFLYKHSDTLSTPIKPVRCIDVQHLCEDELLLLLRLLLSVTYKRWVAMMCITFALNSHTTSDDRKDFQRDKCLYHLRVWSEHDWRSYNDNREDYKCTQLLNRR